MRFTWILLLLVSFVIVEGCDNQSPSARSLKPSPTAFTDPPAWASEVVWYQIFVERFYNGDTSNDPTPYDLTGSYPGFVPEGWSLTPWTHDWYAPDPWFPELEGKQAAAGHDIVNFGQKAQLRRYGGDLEGVMNKIDYLDSLGVTAIYFNPLNDAPSLHKYDARTWRHIDRNFGPDPRGDENLIASETPDDPSTWTMTAADQLFVEVIKAFHQRGIKVILDYSWNHTGRTFWAIEDIRENGEESAFKDWYWINEFDDPATEEDELTWQGWIGIADLPEIQETVQYHGPVKAYDGNLVSESVKQHIFNISKRWLDPDGNGDPSDGVDGFRLDVAGELPIGFWQEYRKEVRAVNPDCYLVGEIWWEEYPDKLLDPQPFLKGDVFDAVMNYRWYRAARHFFAGAPDQIPVTEFVDSLNSFSSNLREASLYSMMNLTASHDVPRVATSLFNPNPYKVGASPNNPEYMIHRPDGRTIETQRLLLAQQFTFIGSPHIWMGDEMGMWGADDPDCRKPLIWPEFEFDPERTHPLGLERPVDEVAFDQELFDYYRQLIEIRNSYEVLRTGQMEYLMVDDENRVLAYRRYDETSEILVLFNVGSEESAVAIPARYENGYTNLLTETKSLPTEGRLEISVSPRTAMILSSQ